MMGWFSSSPPDEKAPSKGGVECTQTDYEIAKMGIDKDQEQEKARRKKQLRAGVCCLILVVVIAALVGSLVATDDNRKGGDEGGTTSQRGGIFNQKNDQCGTAMWLTAKTNAFVESIDYLTDTNITCADANGLSLWYKIEGTGNSFRVSSCENPGLHNPMPLVLTGEDCDSLVCQDDDAISVRDCNDGSDGINTTFLTKPDTDYYVAMQRVENGITYNEEEINKLFSFTIEEVS